MGFRRRNQTSFHTSIKWDSLFLDLTQFVTFEGILFSNNSNETYALHSIRKRLVNQMYSLFAKLDDLEPERISCISNSINLNF